MAEDRRPANLCLRWTSAWSLDNWHLQSSDTCSTLVMDQKIINNDVSFLRTAGNGSDKLTDRHFDISLFHVGAYPSWVLHVSIHDAQVNIVVKPPWRREISLLLKAAWTLCASLCGFSSRATEKTIRRQTRKSYVLSFFYTSSQMWEPTPCGEGWAVSCQTPSAGCVGQAQSS